VVPHSGGVRNSGVYPSRWATGHRSLAHEGTSRFYASLVLAVPPDRCLRITPAIEERVQALSADTAAREVVEVLG
jgi:hypothetical protein